MKLIGQYVQERQKEEGNESEGERESELSLHLSFFFLSFFRALSPQCRDTYEMSEPYRKQATIPKEVERDIVTL